MTEPPNPSPPQVYPALSRWLTGAVEGNIWRERLAAAGQNSDPLLGPMEAILAVLDEGNPNRLDRKRRDFRMGADTRNQLNLRVELLFAYRLVKAGIPFEFGGDSQPDLGCDPPGHQRLWVELTTRDRDDVSTLHDEMETALADLPVLVELRLPTRRLVIPAQDRHTMCRRVRDAVSARSSGFVTVPLSEVGGEALCTVDSPVGGGVVLDINSDLTGHLDSVHRELKNVLGLKRTQAERDFFDPTTLLVLDASRLGLSWLRPERVWGPVLARLKLDWSEIPFVGLMICFTSLDTLNIGGALVNRPGIGQAQSETVDAVAKAFGFVPTSGS